MSGDLSKQDDPYLEGPFLFHSNQSLSIDEMAALEGHRSAINTVCRRILLAKYHEPLSTHDWVHPFATADHAATSTLGKIILKTGSHNDNQQVTINAFARQNESALYNRSMLHIHSRQRCAAAQFVSWHTDFAMQVLEVCYRVIRLSHNPDIAQHWLSTEFNTWQKRLHLFSALPTPHFCNETIARPIHCATTPWEIKAAIIQLARGVQGSLPTPVVEHKSKSCLIKGDGLMSQNALKEANPDHQMVYYLDAKNSVAYVYFACAFLRQPDSVDTEFDIASTLCFTTPFAEHKNVLFHPFRKLVPLANQIFRRLVIDEMMITVRSGIEDTTTYESYLIYQFEIGKYQSQYFEHVDAVANGTADFHDWMTRRLVKLYTAMFQCLQQAYDQGRALTWLAERFGDAEKLAFQTLLYEVLPPMVMTVRHKVAAEKLQAKLQIRSGALNEETFPIHSQLWGQYQNHLQEMLTHYPPVIDLYEAVGAFTAAIKRAIENGDLAQIKQLYTHPPDIAQIVEMSSDAESTIRQLHIHFDIRELFFYDDTRALWLTPLCYAVIHEDSAIVEYLLSVVRCNPNTTNHTNHCPRSIYESLYAGISAFSYAMQNHKIAELLLKFGANPYQPAPSSYARYSSAITAFAHHDGYSDTIARSKVLQNIIQHWPSALVATGKRHPVLKTFQTIEKLARAICEFPLYCSTSMQAEKPLLTIALPQTACHGSASLHPSQRQHLIMAFLGDRPDKNYLTLMVSQDNAEEVVAKLSAYLLTGLAIDTLNQHLELRGVLDRSTCPKGSAHFAGDRRLFLLENPDIKYAIDCRLDSDGHLVITPKLAELDDQTKSAVLRECCSWLTKIFPMALLRKIHDQLLINITPRDLARFYQNSYIPFEGSIEVVRNKVAIAKHQSGLWATSGGHHNTTLDRRVHNEFHGIPALPADDTHIERLYFAKSRSKGDTSRRRITGESSTPKNVIELNTHPFNSPLYSATTGWEFESNAVEWLTLAEMRGQKIKLRTFRIKGQLQSPFQALFAHLSNCLSEWSECNMTVIYDVSTERLKPHHQVGSQFGLIRDEHSHAISRLDPFLLLACYRNRVEFQAQIQTHLNTIFGTSPTGEPHILLREIDELHRPIFSAEHQAIINLFFKDQIQNHAVNLFSACEQRATSHRIEVPENFSITAAQWRPIKEYKDHVIAYALGELWVINKAETLPLVDIKYAIVAASCYQHCNINIVPQCAYTDHSGTSWIAKAYIPSLQALPADYFAAAPRSLLSQPRYVLDLITANRSVALRDARNNKIYVDGFAQAFAHGAGSREAYIEGRIGIVGAHHTPDEQRQLLTCYATHINDSRELGDVETDYETIFSDKKDLFHPLIMVLDNRFADFKSLLAKPDGAVRPGSSGDSFSLETDGMGMRDALLFAPDEGFSPDDVAPGGLTGLMGFNF